ncbi:MAG: hypothetical protein AB7L13_04485 [Acidimicrobiia bacterium]
MSAATRICPSCNAEYLGWVERCSSCGTALVDVRADDLGSFDVPEEQQVVYELIEWPMTHRLALENALRLNHIHHAWEGTDLVVHEDDEARVDDLVDAVDPSGASTEDGGEIVYDLTEWGSEEIRSLEGRLDGAGIPYEWESPGALVVPAMHEETVEQLMDEVEFPNEIPAEDDDAGDERAAAVLSELFLSTDRLMNDPESAEGTRGLIDALELSVSAPAPYGIALTDWRAVLDRCEAIRELLVVDALDIEAIGAQSAEVRHRLREWV